jgi:hypothetical protein
MIMRRGIPERSQRPTPEEDQKALEEFRKLPIIRGIERAATEYVTKHGTISEADFWGELDSRCTCNRDGDYLKDHSEDCQTVKYLLDLGAS